MNISGHEQLERLILSLLRGVGQYACCSLQVPYKRHRGVDDAVLTLLHGTYTPVEKPRSFTKLVFVDFPSAFNAVQPHLMGLKLLWIDVNTHLMLWIPSFQFIVLVTFHRRPTRSCNLTGSVHALHQ